jgi:aspartyl-tRNA(Asn)/glutamyl-tRNA(Gln) amidotransferase subunit A
MSNLTITQLHDAFDRKELSSEKLTRVYLDTARASKINAYLHFCEERAFKQASVADAIIAREGRVPRDKFPLLGIPLAYKDNLVVDGVRTTCGSKVLENYIPPYTATAVQRLEAAGAIALGKTNCDEFSMGGSNENSAFGPVMHPTHPDRVPGGSSGGSAAAVGARLCAASLGSDTGGSIRLPASYCGVVGVKPTYGRISRSGLVAFASTLDQIGPLTRSVEDAAVLLDVMTGHDPLDSTSARRGPTRCREAVKSAPDWSKLRIGYAKEWFEELSQFDVHKPIWDALDWFKSKGAQVSEVSLPHASYAVATYYIIAVSEASSNLSRFDGVRFGVRPREAMEAGDLASFYQKVRAGFGAEVKRRIVLGTFALSSGYADAYYKRACQVRRLIKQDFDHAFKQVDLIAGPVSVSTAYKLGEKSNDPLSMYLNDTYTVSANLAGLPALSVPCGDLFGLPVGLHLMAPQFQEEALLQAAHAFEKGRATP